MRVYTIEGSCIATPSDFFHAAALDLRFRNFYAYDLATLGPALSDFTGDDQIPLITVNGCEMFARGYPVEYGKVYDIFRKVEAEGAIGLEWEAPEPKAPQALLGEAVTNDSTIEDERSTLAVIK